jgi:hypothetical protein
MKMTYEEARAETERLLDPNEIGAGSHEWAWFEDIVPVLLAEIDRRREPA